MASASIKRVIRIGGSLSVTLPPAWAKGKVSAGDEVALIGNGELRLMPLHDKVAKPKRSANEEKGKRPVRAAYAPQADTGSLRSGQ